MEKIGDDRLLGSVWKLPARPGAVADASGQEATTSRIGTEIRRGGAPPHGRIRHKHGPCGVFRQSPVQCPRMTTDPPQSPPEFNPDAYRMTIGEHLEELRNRLIIALI